MPSVDDWHHIAQLCIKHDLWLMIDQVYSGLVYDDSFFSPASIEGMAQRTVTVSSVSKSHAMTGWRVGWTVGPIEFSEHMANLALCMVYGCPGFVQQAAVIALTQDLPEVETMRQTYRQRRDVFYSVLSSCKHIEVHLPEGGMFLMIDIRKTALSAQQFAHYLLDNYGVSVLSGEAFGPSAAGHVRCCLCVDEVTLTDAAARITRCVEQLV